MSGITLYRSTPTLGLVVEASPNEGSDWDNELFRLPSRLSHLEGEGRTAVPRRSAFAFSPLIPIQEAVFQPMARIETAATRALEFSSNIDPASPARSSPSETPGEYRSIMTPKPPQLQGFEEYSMEGEDIETFAEEAATLALAKGSSLVARLRAQRKPDADIMHDLDAGVSLERQLDRLVVVADATATSKFCCRFWC